MRRNLSLALLSCALLLGVACGETDENNDENNSTENNSTENNSTENNSTENNSTENNSTENNTSTNNTSANNTSTNNTSTNNSTGNNTANNSTALTWSNGISTIFTNKCSRCHMWAVNYSEVAADLIEIRSRVAGNHGQVTEEQKQDILAWIDAGAPE